MNANIACQLLGAAERHPERTAVRLDAHELTYAALDAATAVSPGCSARAAIQPGDRVGLHAAQRARVRRRLLRHSCAPGRWWCP
jgi:acyl-CoA synthetase (AMP-forming)/AMP-acid ligase II